MPRPDLESLYQAAETSNQRPSLESLYQNAQGQSQQNQEGAMPTGSFGQRLPQAITPEETIDSRGSAVNLLERAYFQMGDKKGVQEYLQKKFRIVKPQPDGDFFVGDSVNNLRPVDPNGMFNDFLGELAEFVPMLPTIGAGIAGAATGGIPGAMGASAAASAGMKGLGYASGINKQDPFEAGVDVAIDALGQGAAEGINMAMKAAGPQLFKRGFGMIKKGVDATTPIPVERDAKLLNVARIFKATAGIDEDKTLNFIKYLDDGVAEKNAASPQRLLEIIDDFSGSVTNKERQLGMALGKSELSLLNKAKEAPINTAKLQESVVKSMRELGLIDENGLLDMKPIQGNREKATLVRLFEKLNGGSAREVVAGRPTFNQAGKVVSQEKIPVITINPKAEIKASELIGIQRQMNIAREATKDNNVRRIYNNLINGNDDEAFGQLMHGLRNDVEGIAKKLGDTSYMAQRKSYAGFKQILDNLKGYGLDPKENLITTENLTKGASNMAEVLRRELVKFDGLANSNFLKRMEIWDTAKAFQGMNPNIMRFNTVVSMLGLGGLGASLGQSPEAKMGLGAGGLGAGLLLGTPAGAAFTIKQGAKLGRLAGKARVQSLSKESSQKAQRGTLAFLAGNQSRGLKEDRQKRK